MDSKTIAPDDAPLQTRQYSLRSLLVTIVTLSMVLAYIRMFGEEGLLLGLTVLMGAGLWGGIGGLIAGRLTETLTWSLVGGILTLCCLLSSDNHVLEVQKIFWVNVGFVGGAFAGGIAPGNIRVRIIWTALLALFFAVIPLSLGLSQLNMSVDLMLAGFVLAALQVLVEIVHRLRQKYHTALDMWAAGIVFAVIAGNFGAIVVWNIWYR